MVSSNGDGVLMRDTEKRPCTVGVWYAGVPTLLTERDLPFAGDRLLDFGDFSAGVTALGEVDLDFGDCFTEVTALEEGDLAFGDVIPGLAALVEDDLDFGDCFAGV